ncbi:porphobilinogen deaminase [Pyrolobus fumarii 1A]|uniref:Probable porphobilinogen deaminase n=1 Tax=Pyrolobus fumarii (strain DSM 11204 / 1A) TaxID=694429 RepID=G0EGU1_PYRF1|nr:hydroxymethylbilane synthase [Pyrolobus fumarii]AEM39239.1 porphobilinogen deaminase [Pyrolobus fumarii 1A]
MKLRVAARGSKLSLIQVKLAMDWFRRSIPDLDYEVVIVKTRGDIHQDKPFHMIGGKGVFEKEVNLAVLDGRADVAVHSLKDVPSMVDPRLVLAGVPPRDPPYDVLVVRDGYEPNLEALPKGAVVGTASARRRAAILHVRPDLRVEVLRGNVDTRLRKLVSGMYDAIILAEAGLKRLWDELPEELRSSISYARLDPRLVPPAPAQGIIGVYTLAERKDLVEALRKASDEKALVEARAERAFLSVFGGGCHVPVGVLARLEGDTLGLIAVLYSQDGSKRVEVSAEGDASNPELVGIQAALELRKRAVEEGMIA